MPTAQRRRTVSALRFEGAWDRSSHAPPPPSTTVLPPTVASIPTVNSFSLHNSSHTLLERRTSSAAAASRPRSALQQARRRSTTFLHGNLSNSDYVLVIDQDSHKEEAAKEHKERLLKAMMAYSESPRGGGASSSGTHHHHHPHQQKYPQHGAAAEQEFGALEETMMMMPSVSAFQAFAEDTGRGGGGGKDGDAACDEDEISNKSTSEVHLGGGGGDDAPPHGPKTPAFVPRLQSMDTMLRMGVTSATPPSLSPGRQSMALGTARTSFSVGKTSRRKSLKNLMQIPNDVLSSLGVLEDGFAGLDDEKLLNIEEQAEIMLSARRHKAALSSALPSAAPSPRVLTPQPARLSLPQVEKVDFQKEIREALQSFSAIETVAELLSSLEGYLRDLHIDLVRQVHVPLAFHLEEQIAVAQGCLTSTKELLQDSALPKWADLQSTIDSLTESVATEKKTNLKLKEELSKVRRAMRQHNILPAKWGVLPPECQDTDLVVLCMDCPVARDLYDDDPSVGRAAMKLLMDLCRKLMRDTKHGYEVFLEGCNGLFIFTDAKTAIDWALQLQSQLTGLSWSEALLKLPCCAADTKLLWRGLAVRVSLFEGPCDSEFDSATQTTHYYGAPVHSATVLMQRAPAGSIVVPTTLLNRCGVGLEDFATHGGAVTSKEMLTNVDGEDLRICWLVPHALRGRLTTPEFANHSCAQFLSLSLVPDDHVAHALLPNNNGGSAVDGDAQVTIHRAYLNTIDQDEERLKNLALISSDQELQEKASIALHKALSANLSVCTVVVSIVGASTVFEQRRECILPTVHVFLATVAKCVKGIQSGTDVAMVGETASLVFLSRTDALSFAAKFARAVASAAWAPETLAAWESVHKGFPVQMVGGMNFGALQKKEESVLLGGFAGSFDVACALSRIALPGEILATEHYRDAVSGGGDAPSAALSSVGLFSIHSPSYDGEIFIAASNVGTLGSRGAGSQTRVGLAGEGVAWPSAKSISLLKKYYRESFEAHRGYRRQMEAAIAEKDQVSRLRPPPPPRQAVMVATEVHIPHSLWQQAEHRYVLLEALRSVMKCFRSVLLESDGGCEWYSGLQSYHAAFPTPVAALKFSLAFQDRLASMHWPPALGERFPTLRRQLNEKQQLRWNGLRVRCAVVSANSETFSGLLSHSRKTMFYGKSVRGVVQCCSFARYGEVLIDDELASYVVGHRSEFGDPTIKHIGTVRLLGFLNETKLYSVSSVMLKGRVFPPLPKSLCDIRSFGFLAASFQADENPVVYQMAAPTPHRNLPQQQQHATPAKQHPDSETTARDPLFGGGGSSTPIPHFSAFTSRAETPIVHRLSIGDPLGPLMDDGGKATPDPFETSSTLHPLHSARLQGPTLSGITLLASTAPQHHHSHHPQQQHAAGAAAVVSRRNSSIVEDTDNIFRTAAQFLRTLADHELLYIRMTVLKDTSKGFKTEDDFLRLFVTSCHEVLPPTTARHGSSVLSSTAPMTSGGSSSTGDSSALHKAFLALCHGSSGDTPASLSTPGKGIMADDRSLLSSIAECLCSLHLMLSRSLRKTKQQTNHFHNSSNNNNNNNTNTASNTVTPQLSINFNHHSSSNINSGSNNDRSPVMGSTPQHQRPRSRSLAVTPSSAMRTASGGGLSASSSRRRSVVSSEVAADLGAKEVVTESDEEN